MLRLQVNLVCPPGSPPLPEKLLVAIPGSARLSDLKLAIETEARRATPEASDCRCQGIYTNEGYLVGGNEQISVFFSDLATFYAKVGPEKPWGTPPAETTHRPFPIDRSTATPPEFQWESGPSPQNIRRALEAMGSGAVSQDPQKVRVFLNFVRDLIRNRHKYSTEIAQMFPPGMFSGVFREILTKHTQNIDILGEALRHLGVLARVSRVLRQQLVRDGFQALLTHLIASPRVPNDLRGQILSILSLLGESSTVSDQPPLLKKQISGPVFGPSDILDGFSSKICRSENDPAPLHLPRPGGGSYKAPPFSKRQPSDFPKPPERHPPPWVSDPQPPWEVTRRANNTSFRREFDPSSIETSTPHLNFSSEVLGLLREPGQPPATVALVLNSIAIDPEKAAVLVLRGAQGPGKLVHLFQQKIPEVQSKTFKLFCETLSRKLTKASSAALSTSDSVLRMVGSLRGQPSEAQRGIKAVLVRMFELEREQFGVQLIFGMVSSSDRATRVLGSQFWRVKADPALTPTAPPDLIDFENHIPLVLRILRKRADDHLVLKNLLAGVSSLCLSEVLRPTILSHEAIPTLVMYLRDGDVFPDCPRIAMRGLFNLAAKDPPTRRTVLDKLDIETESLAAAKMDPVIQSYLVTLLRANK